MVYGGFISKEIRGLINLFGHGLSGIYKQGGVNIILGNERGKRAGLASVKEKVGRLPFTLLFFQFY